MQRKLRPKLTFFLVGLFLWALGGWIVAAACFQPVTPLAYGLDVMKENKELAKEIMNTWGVVMVKVIIIWALAGGILGIVIYQLFIARPVYEHFISAPKPAGMPEMLGFSGPETMAEISAGLQGWILGLIMGVCGTVFILPLLQNELIAVKQLSIRIIFGIIQTLIVTVPILPFSLRILRMKSERKD